MILTRVAADRLPDVLERFATSLQETTAKRVFARIALPAAARRARGAAARADREAALRVAAALGMRLLAGSPREGCSWDGHAMRIGTEAYVLLHETAHFQLAAPERRHRVDFGLGPGPETGDRQSAAAAQSVFDLAREREEAMASLLGILWESELRQPALASFLYQNWLEGAGRPGTAAHFENILARLQRAGFVSAEGRPNRHLRRRADEHAFR